MTANRSHFQHQARVSEHEAKRIIGRLFAEWLQSDVAVEDETHRQGGDFVVRLPSATLLVEFKTTANAPVVRQATEQLKAYAKKGAVPVVAVPFMGEVGRRICSEAGVGWIDLSGNADIHAPRLRILVGGRPNRYVHLGRPATPFAPKSSRLSRWLLIHPNTAFTQRELAKATDLDPSQISRLVARLAEQRLVKTDGTGRVALSDRRLMLDAWSADYSFQRHDILKGHMPGRAGDETMHKLARELDIAGTTYAFTGLAGAWPYTQFAGFRLVTAYVGKLPDPSLRRKIDFVEQDKGSNVWLVLPNDTDVLQGVRRVEDVTCAHPVQVWLDLKEQPERSADAAAEILERILKGEFDG